MTQEKGGGAAGVTQAVVNKINTNGGTGGGGATGAATAVVGMVMS